MIGLAKNSFLDKITLFAKKITAITSKITDRPAIKFLFVTGVILHYTLKFFNVKFIAIPKMSIECYGCFFETRKNTFDFWPVCEGSEREIAAYLLQKNMEPGVFVDIGANIGKYSILMAKNRWQVYSFEPVKSTLDRLKLNALVNGVNDNINIYHTALGDRSSREMIYFDRHNYTLASLVLKNKKLETCEEVKIEKLDHILNEQFDREVIMKIDAEGFEYEVLKGAQDFIRKNHPAIIIEIWQQNSEKVHNLLNGLGYKKEEVVFTYKGTRQK